MNQNIGSGVNIDREIDDSLDIGQGTNTNDESASMNGMLDIGQGANAHRRSDIGQGAYYSKERVTDRRINQISLRYCASNEVTEWRKKLQILANHLDRTCYA